MEKRRKLDISRVSFIPKHEPRFSATRRTNLEQKYGKAACPSGPRELPADSVGDPEDSAERDLEYSTARSGDSLGYQSAYENPETDSVKMRPADRVQRDNGDYDEDSAAECRPDHGCYRPELVSGMKSATLRF